MKNLNEPHKDLNEPSKNEIQKAEPEVIPFERRPVNPKAIEKQETKAGPLLPHRQMEEMRGRWANVQSSFVDEPRNAVEEADQLVRMAIKQIEEGFSAERAELEKQWSRGDKVSTEDLRVCL